MKTLPALFGFLGILVIAGSIGPWATIGLLNIAGTSGDGQITLILGCTAVGLAVLAGTTTSQWAELVACATLVLAGVGGLYDWKHVHRLAASRNVLTAAVRVGWGLELVTIAGLASCLLLVGWMVGAAWATDADDTDEWDDGVDDGDSVERSATAEAEDDRSREPLVHSIPNGPIESGVETGANYADEPTDGAEDEDAAEQFRPLEDAHAGEAMVARDPPDAPRGFRNPKVLVPAWAAMLAVAGTAAGIWWFVVR